MVKQLCAFNLALVGFHNHPSGQLPGWKYATDGASDYEVGLNFVAQFDADDGNKLLNEVTWQSTAILVGNGMDGSVQPLPYLDPIGTPPSGGPYTTIPGTPGSTNRGVSRMVVDIINEVRQ